jgi:hypothetical protein
MPMRPIFRWVVAVPLLVAPSLAGAQSRPKPADPIFGVDKVKHFFIAGFVETMTFSGLQAAGVNRSSARGGAIGATTVVSLGREFHDRERSCLGCFGCRRGTSCDQQDEIVEVLVVRSQELASTVSYLPPAAGHHYR